MGRLCALLALLAIGCLASAQVSSLELYDAPDFQNILAPHNLVFDGDTVCGLLLVNTTTAPYPCYNITVNRVRICTGTVQDLVQFDPADPGNTGCHTPIETGIIVTNTLYDSAHPASLLSIFYPHFHFQELTGNLTVNAAAFCFDAGITEPFVSAIEVDWAYEAILCPDPDLNSGVDTEDTGSCAGDPSCPCDGVSDSGAALDACGVCRLPTNQTSNTMTVRMRIRDFNATGSTGGHPDFEYTVATDRGIVTNFTSFDGKPIYGNHPLGTTTTHSKLRFDQWYRDVNGVNVGKFLDLEFTIAPGSTTTYRFSNTSFFPIDNQLFGNQGRNHNFHMTGEMHLQLTYLNASKSFNFSGDDDLWVFINGQLVIDLGGIHGQQTASVTLGSLGLTLNQTYQMDVFWAERHTTQSVFIIETDIDFSCTCLDNCGVCGGDGSTCSTSPPPTTSSPPTTTPPPTTTTPPPTTTTPPPTTTVPPTTTPDPTTTSPPTTTPPPTITTPPPPSSGNSTTGTNITIICPEGYDIVFGLGCIPETPMCSALCIVLSTLVGVLACALAAFCIGYAIVAERRARHGQLIVQRTEILIDEELNGLHSNEALDPKSD